MWLQFLSFQILSRFLQHLEVEQHVPSHSTELKNRILAQIPELKLIEKLCGDGNLSSSLEDCILRWLDVK